MPRLLEQRKSYHPDLAYLRRTRDAFAEDDRYPKEIRAVMLESFDSIIASFFMLGVDGCPDDSENIPLVKQNIGNRARSILTKLDVQK